VIKHLRPLITLLLGLSLMGISHTSASVADEPVPQLIFSGIVDCPASNPVREIVAVAGLGKTTLETQCWVLEVFQARTEFNSMISRAADELSPKQFQKLSDIYNNAFAQAKMYLAYSKFTVYSKCIPWTFNTKNKAYSGQSCIYNNNLAKNAQYLADSELADKLFENAWTTAVTLGSQTASLTCIEWKMPYESPWFDGGNTCFYPEKSRKRMKTTLGDAIQKAFSNEIEQDVVQDVAFWYVNELPSNSSDNLVKLRFFPNLKWLDVQVSTVSTETCRIDRVNSLLRVLKKGNCDLSVKLQNEDDESFSFNLTINFK
jgi:hypothetical protein